MRTRIARRWRSVSFRAGLWSALSVGIVAITAIFILLVLVFALFVVTDGLAQTALLDRAEDQLRLGVPPDELELSTLSGVGGEDRGPNGDRSFWAVLTDGAVVVSEGEVLSELIDAEFSDPGFGVEFEAEQGLDDTVGLKTAQGTDWFFVERIVTAPDGSAYRVVTASDGIFSVMGFVRASLPVTIPVVLVLMTAAMAVTSYLMRRALRRVERMRAQVELISQESLNRRVPLVDADDNIDRLAITMNDMLERLETSTAQQQQFLADASHELRSPLAGLVAQLDVATAYPDRVDAQQLLPKLQGEVGRLQRLVDDLLFLSRSEASTGAAPDGVSVDIDRLMDLQAERSGLTAEGIRVEVVERSGAMVIGSEPDLERVLRNLVDNAIRHAGGIVALSTTRSGGDVVLAVHDDGPGIGAEDHDRVFERFVRLDEARSRDAGGSGLGLAITRELVVRHGGRVELAPSERGARFEVRLPIAA